MTPITSQDHSSSSNHDRGAGDAAFHALIPFSGGLSPGEVRSRMAGPNLNGPPSTIWRRTTIQHSNADGSFCLYACERTGEALWIPVGEYFVADRPRRAQQAGTIMDYLLSPGRTAIRPEGYRAHHTGRITSGENANIRQPSDDHGRMAGCPERSGATRLHRFNPMSRPVPATAGMGSRRTVARRERRDRVRESHNPLPPTPSTATSTMNGGNNQDRPHAPPNADSTDIRSEEARTTIPTSEVRSTASPPLTTASPTPLMSTITIHHRRNPAPENTTSPELATLNLSDEEDN